MADMKFKRRALVIHLPTVVALNTIKALLIADRSSRINELDGKEV